MSGPGDRGPLQSLGIALDLIDFVAAEPNITITSLAVRAGIAKSTASRTCSVLCDRGLLERGPDDGLVLGGRVVELGKLSRLRRGLSSSLVVALTDVRDAVRETVQLAVVQGVDVSYVERVEADRRLRYTIEKYRTSALHTSSCGKVLAAWDPDLTQRSIATGLAPETGYTIVSAERFRNELAEIRDRGYATQVEEKELGAASLAVPVRSDDGGPVVAALGMAGPVRRVIDGRNHHLEALRAGARTIGRLVAEGSVSLPTRRR